MTVPQGSFILINRSVMRIQGGYFFMFFITSIKAVNTIANVIKYIISSVIMTYTPPFSRELKQPPPFLYAFNISQSFVYFNKNIIIRFLLISEIHRACQPHNGTTRSMDVLCSIRLSVLTAQEYPFP